MGDSGNSPARRSLLSVVLLVVVVLAVFGQVANHEFLAWDDQRHILDNPQLSPVTWSSVGRLWVEPYWGLYIPASYTFFAAEATIAPRPLPDGAGRSPNPRVFHLGNLALHVACVLLVFAILRRFVCHNGAAVAGALLFGLHPVQVESVAWVSETRGVLCAAFSLLAIWLYFHSSGLWGFAALSRQPPRGRCPTEPGGAASKTAIAYYVMASMAFLLALLSKPAAVAVPLVVVALDWGLGRRPLLKALLRVSPWLLVAAGWVVATKIQQPDTQLPFVPPWWLRPLVAGDALAFYLHKVLVPWPCGPDYGRTPAWVVQQWWIYVSWLFPAAALAVLACFPGRRQWLTAAGVFGAWLLPVLGLVPFVFQRISTVADRYLYLAMLGPALVLAWLLARHWSRRSVTAAATVLCALAVLSFLQTRHWRDNQALIAHGLKVNPGSVVAKEHRGHLLAEEGRHSEAVKWYRSALRDHPQIDQLYINLAASLVALGHVDEAIEALREATENLPRQALIHCRLADLLLQQGEVEKAEDHYDAALRIAPDFGPAHLALGKLRYEQGNVEAAIDHNRKALGDPLNRVQAHVNLGVALQALGRPDEALYHYRTVLEIRPRWASAHYNLANLLSARGAMDRAIKHYRLALESDPKHAAAHVNLGIALLQRKQNAGAMEHLRAALRIKPDLVEVHVHLGHALAAEGRGPEAAAEYRAALRLVGADSEKARSIRKFLKPYGDE